MQKPGLPGRASLPLTSPDPETSRDGKGKNSMLKTLQISTVATLFALNEALAQTAPATPGAPPAPADDGSGASWLWIILGLAILAGLIWYFMRGRSRATTAGTTSSSTTSGTATSHPKVFDNDKRK
jgi:hypothetical protein